MRVPEDSSIEAGSCGQTMKRLYDARLWEQLEDSLSAIEGPAVMLLATAAHRSLLHNFLCSLQSQSMGHLLNNVVVWCADKITHATLVSDWDRGGVSKRAIQLDSVWVEEDKPSVDAEYRTQKYSKIAEVKAFMPWAAAVLGYDALVQDLDIVWRVDMLAYLKATMPNARGVVMANHHKVDISWPTCNAHDEKNMHRHITNPRYKPASFTEGCVYYRCNRYVNGRFVYTAAKSGAPLFNNNDNNNTMGRRGDFVKAMEAWAGRCPEIQLRKRNQPHMVMSLLSTMAPGDCVYAKEAATTTADPRSWRPFNEIQNMAVLDFNLVASGENFSHVEETDAASRLLLYHGNFVSGVEDKCAHLRALGMLFTDFETCVSPRDIQTDGGGCDPLSSPRKCTLGKCVVPSRAPRTQTDPLLGPPPK